jgi:hypothetical protein
MTNVQIDELISQMTITEKLGQLTQLAPFFLGMDPTMDLTGPMSEMNLKPEWIKEVGSTLNGFGAKELKALLSPFESVECYGVGGNEQVWAYYEKNREAVHRIMRFDVLKMQWWLPRWILQLPYDVANRLNRRSLHSQNTALTESITMDDYKLQEVDDRCFDLFYVATK